MHRTVLLRTVVLEMCEGEQSDCRLASGSIVSATSALPQNFKASLARAALSEMPAKATWRLACSTCARRSDMDWMRMNVLSENQNDQ